MCFLSPIEIGIFLSVLNILAQNFMTSLVEVQTCWLNIFKIGIENDVYPPFMWLRQCCYLSPIEDDVASVSLALCFSKIYTILVVKGRVSHF